MTKSLTMNHHNQRKLFLWKFHCIYDMNSKSTLFHLWKSTKAKSFQNVIEIFFPFNPRANKNPFKWKTFWTYTSINFMYSYLHHTAHTWLHQWSFSNILDANRDFEYHLRLELRSYQSESEKISPRKKHHAYPIKQIPHPPDIASIVEFHIDY